MTSLIKTAPHFQELDQGLTCALPESWFFLLQWAEAGAVSKQATNRRIWLTHCQQQLPNLHEKKTGFVIHSHSSPTHN